MNSPGSRIQPLFSSSVYHLSEPRIEVARATNKCRSCRASIKKGEKYILCFGWDQKKQFYLKGHQKPISPKVTVKVCKECSVELLKLKIQKGALTGPTDFKSKVLSNIRELVFYRNRFNILKERDPVVEFLNKKGIYGQPK
jgi:hypothetical protein